MTTAIIDFLVFLSVMGQPRQQRT